jgi:hypothetical protein
MFIILLRDFKENPASFYGLSLLFGLLIFLTSVVLWAFPLAAWFWRKKNATTSVSAWVFLDGTPEILPSQAPLRPRQTLMIGIGMGLVFCLALEVVFSRKHLPLGIAETIQSAFL